MNDLIQDIAALAESVSELARRRGRVNADRGYDRQPTIDRRSAQGTVMTGDLRAAPATSRTELHYPFVGAARSSSGFRPSGQHLNAGIELTAIL
jgi:hypothetical protein